MGEQGTKQGAGVPGPPEDDAAALFAPGELRDWLGFIGRAVLRRRLRAAVAFLLVGGCMALGNALLPRTYRASVRLLAQPAEGAPGGTRTVAWGEAEGLAQGAAETALRREHLLAMVDEHDLVARWRGARSAPMRGVDRARRWLSGAPEPTDAELREALVDVLAQAVRVHVEGSVAELRVAWPEPGGALRLVESAQRRFLEARRQAELLPLARKVEVLEHQGDAVQRTLDATLARIQEAIGRRRQGARAATVHGVQATGRWRDMPDPELARLRQQLLTLRGDLQTQEDAHRARLAELTPLLAEQRALYAPGHPTLVATEERVAALKQQAQPLEALKAREQRLLAEFVRGGGKDGELSARPESAWPRELMEDDEEVTYGRARLQAELFQLAALRGQLADARVALAAAETGFPERYAVITPAQAPTAPTRPSLALLGLAWLLGGLLVAVLAAVAADLHGGRIHESWQVERLARVPVLAETHEP